MKNTINKPNILTNQQRAEQCRNAEFFISFPWETDSQILERFERESITTLEGLANTIVNYWINFGVRHRLNFGCYPTKLEEFALIQLEDHSEKLKAMQNPSSRSQLSTMLEFDEMKHLVSQTLKAFEHSVELQDMWIRIQFPNRAVVTA